MRTYTGTPEHVRDLKAVEGTSLSSLTDASSVVISSVGFPALSGYNGKRFAASLAATERYTAADVRQIVMFDTSSHYHVPLELARRGAVVVPAPRPGLATPYLDAAHLVRLHAGEGVYVIKSEADKPLTADDVNTLNHALDGQYDLVVGDRTDNCLSTLTDIQHRTEAAIDATLAQTLGIPHGASSGVQAYGPAALDLFLRYEEQIPSADSPAGIMLGNNWKYLIQVPALAQEMGLAVGSVYLDFEYDAEMIEAEHKPALTLKRLEQLLLMLEGGYEVAAMLGFQSGYRPLDADRQQGSAQLLGSLRSLVAAVS